MKDSEDMAPRPPKPDGERLLAMMDEKKVSQSKLATEMRVTPTSISRYLDRLSDGTLPDATWSKMVYALRRLDVTTAEQIRPVHHNPMADVTSGDTSHLASLVHILDRWKERDDLVALIQILEGSDAARAVLLLMARDRMKQKP